MSVAVVDVREWQKSFDLRTGKSIESCSPAVDLVRRVLKRRPYPGDTDRLSDNWVNALRGPLFLGKWFSRIAAAARRKY